MIDIELTTAIALYSAVLGLLTIALWLYTELSVRRPQRHLGKQFLWRCEICGLTYLDEEATQLSQCPRCASYNTLDSKQAPGVETYPAQESPTLQKDEPRRNPSKSRGKSGGRRGGRRRR